MRVKIKDLSEDCRISMDELELIRGGDAASDLRRRIEAANDQYSSACLMSIAHCISSICAGAALGIGSRAGSTGDSSEPTKTSVLDGAHRRDT